MPDQEDLKKALKDWADSLIAHSEEQIRIRSIRTFLSFSHPYDRYSNWIMVGVTGGLLALLSNLSELVSLIGYGTLKIVLLLLIMSLLFGILQRSLAHMVQVGLHAEIDGEQNVRAVAESHSVKEEEVRAMAERNNVEVDASINILRALTSYYSLMPRPYKWWTHRQIQKIILDNDYARKKLIRAFFRQSFYSLVQLLLALAALVIVMLKL